MHIYSLEGKTIDREKPQICGLREWVEGVGEGTRHKRRGQEPDGRGIVECAHTNKVANHKNTEKEELRTDGKD